MTAIHQISRWHRQVLWRHWLSYLLVGLPLLIAFSFLCFRFIDERVCIVVLVLGLLTLLAFVSKTATKFNRQWLIRQLDERRKTFENSSDLLFSETSSLNTLQQLQQQRVQQRVSADATLDLRREWPVRRIIFSILISGLMLAVAWFWPSSVQKITQTSQAQNELALSSKSPVRLQSVALLVQAPAYTGLPSRTEYTLNAKVPEGSMLSWKLGFKPQPQVAELVFLDGKRIALQERDGVWQAATRLNQSSLYRIEINRIRLPDDKLFRLQAIKDLAPVLRVIEPDRSLSIAEFDQKYWDIHVEASDDYGLGVAQLRIQSAQGTGENITFKQFSKDLLGTGTAKQKRYSYRMSLADFGLTAGDDLIVQLSVSDRRTPKANVSLSSSYILRWPTEETTEASGMQGMLKKVAPAFFRSQRQIIIDTEKLIAERKIIGQDDYERRSDQIGVDQRLLRLRYGQFLGEESEGGDKDAHEKEHASEPPSKTNAVAEILSEYGHTHDIPEAATLLDPKSKELLRSALNEMWQAELHLRQVEPKLALPYENRALALIKKVQQADRIYLARVGDELPPIDETRRLSGDRKNLSQGTEKLSTSPIAESEVTKFWQALNSAQLGQQTGSLDFNALQSWINVHQENLPDVLSLLAALDALQQQPDCQSCREQVRVQLWPLLPKPTALPNSRQAPNANGQRYLQELSKDGKP